MISHYLNLFLERIEKILRKEECPEILPQEFSELHPLAFEVNRVKNLIYNKFLKNRILLKKVPELSVNSSCDGSVLLEINEDGMHFCFIVMKKDSNWILIYNRSNKYFAIKGNENNLDLAIRNICNLNNKL